MVSRLLKRGRDGKGWGGKGKGDGDSRRVAVDLPEHGRGGCSWPICLMSTVTKAVISKRAGSGSWCWGLCGAICTQSVESPYDGKEWAFWHCISDGPEDAERLPDLRRLER